MELEITTLIVGAVTIGLVEVAKRVHGIPLNPKNTNMVRGLAGVLSFSGTFLMAWTQGDLASPEFATYLGTAAEGLVAYFVAFLGYESVLHKRRDEKTNGEFTG